MPVQASQLPVPGDHQQGMGAGASWLNRVHFANDDPLENMVRRTTATYYSHDLCFRRQFLCIMVRPLLSLGWWVQPVDG